jgi:hypothetical protein
VAVTTLSIACQPSWPPDGRLSGRHAVWIMDHEGAGYRRSSQCAVAY